MTIFEVARRDGCSAALGATAYIWRLPALIGITLAVLLTMGGAKAEEDLKRVALVIGNATYDNAPQLANPRNDARAMSVSLRNLGFIVEEGVDLDTAGMYRAVRAFGALAESADVALVFYAGHGIQVDGTNYLLPTDVSLTRERDLNYEGVSLDLVMSEVAQTKRLGVVIIDACRDNPFAEQLARSMGPTRSTLVGRGLARVEAAPADTLIAFATRDGAVADDGEGVNSPYTTALLSHLTEPGLEILQYFRRVRDTVLDSTNGRQEPFVYGSLSAEQFYLNPPPPPTTGELASRGLRVEEDRSAEIVFWETIKDSTDTADFDAYLRQFPTGVFADLARNQIAGLTDTSELAVVTRVVPPVPDSGLTPVERREIQTSLRRLDLYAGAIDGLFGGGTRGAIAAFQDSIGDIPSGALTPAQTDLLHQRAAALPPAPVIVEPVIVEPVIATLGPEPVVIVDPVPPPPADGQFGAIATTGRPVPSRTGYCQGKATQAEANECALADCGSRCEIQITFGTGQCGAYAEASEKTSGIGFGVGATRDDAVEAALIECRRDASRGRYCRLRVSRCNS